MIIFPTDLRVLSNYRVRIPVAYHHLYKGDERIICCLIDLEEDVSIESLSKKLEAIKKHQQLEQEMLKLRKIY